MFKKLLAFILAAAMVFTMAVPAFAWDSNDVSISDDTYSVMRHFLMPNPNQENGYYFPFDLTNDMYKAEVISVLTDLRQNNKDYLLRLNRGVSDDRLSTVMFSLIVFDKDDCTIEVSGEDYIMKSTTPSIGYAQGSIYEYATSLGTWDYVFSSSRTDRLSATYGKPVYFASNNYAYTSNCPEIFPAIVPFIKDAVIQPILKSSIPAESHNLTINYLDESGSQLVEPHTRPVESGAAYSVNSPTIPGYTPDKAVISGTMGAEDITETVMYRKNTHSVTVNYQFEDGGKAADSVSQSVKYGETYNIQSPTIAGYTPDKLVVTGTMEDKDLTVTVIYVENPIETKQLTIHYIYEDGSTAADSYTGSLPVGYPYEVVSPPVPGYGADIPIVSGTMPGEDKTITVTYSAAAYQLTVNYLFEDGSKAADSVQQSLLAGTAYRLESPAVDGFKPDKAVVSGSMPSRDYSVTVMYYPDYSGGGGSGDNEEKPDSSNPFEPPPDSYWNELFGDYQFHSPFAMPDWMKGEAGDSGNENPDDNFWDQFLGDYQFHNPFIMPDWMKGTADKGELFALPVEDFYRQLYGNYQWG